jgi:hypothetical protein
LPGCERPVPPKYHRLLHNKGLVSTSTYFTGVPENGRPSTRKSSSGGGDRRDRLSFSFLFSASPSRLVSINRSRPLLVVLTIIFRERIDVSSRVVHCCWKNKVLVVCSLLAQTLRTSIPITIRYHFSLVFIIMLCSFCNNILISNESKKCHHLIGVLDTATPYLRTHHLAGSGARTILVAQPTESRGQKRQVPLSSHVPRVMCFFLSGSTTTLAPHERIVLGEKAAHLLSPAAL